MTSRPKPLVLCILDGWGERPNGADNAIDRAKTPVWHELKRRWPHAQLDASEHYVGLPDGQMGNSEVGHTNIGAGRVVMQDLPRIDKALAEGKAAKLPALQEFIAKLKKSGGTAHVMGLISPGGVHSHQKQIAAFGRIVAEAGVPVAVHAFLDGRDTPPQSAIGYLKQFQQDVAGHGNIRIATVAGRYYAMDRDKRWDRVAKAYRVLTAAAGEHASSSCRPRSPTIGACVTAMGCSSPISAPTASARSPPRCSTRISRVSSGRSAWPSPERSAWSNTRPS